MTTTNPLVAGSVDVSTPFTGAFLLEDGESLIAAIESGDWVQGGMAAFSAVADTVAMVSDPLGSLIATGLGWVMEHVEPLRGWMNDLTGDAGEVAGFSQTWSNVAVQMGQSADELARVVRDLDDMDGEAIQAYLAFQLEAEKHLRAAGSWAEAMAVGLEIASTIVKIVHDIVRDAIAEVVGAVISYAAELVLTAGLATPLVIEQVATRVASLVGRVGKSITKLLSSGKQLSSLLEKLKALFKKADDLFDRILHGSPTPAPKPKPKPDADPAPKPKPNPDAKPSDKQPEPPLPPTRLTDAELRAELKSDMEAGVIKNGDVGYDPLHGQTWDEFLDQNLLGFTDDGYPKWDWPKDHGFEPGTIKDHDLVDHSVIERISPTGSDSGQFAAPPGTPFEQKGLPPDRLSDDFSTGRYEVVRKLPDDVKMGDTAPWFGQPGGGTQYYFPEGFDYYLKADPPYLKLIVD